MKHDEAPYRRWDPKPAWLDVHFHPPKRGVMHIVKRFQDGVPFKATFGRDGFWRDEGGLILSDADLYCLTKT